MGKGAEAKEGINSKREKDDASLDEGSEVISGDHK